MAAPQFATVRPEYRALWDRMEIRPQWRPEVDRAATTILAHKADYLEIERLTGVPWFWTALIHLMECGLNFHGHLHNGDPLSRRTYHVPAGRPLVGNPPFTFVQSACDALRYDGIDKLPDHSLERLCYALEKYNGWGTRAHGTHTPYLWSGSDNYCDADDACGKYVSDGVWNGHVASGQIGAMPVLKELIARDPSIELGEAPARKPVGQVLRSKPFRAISAAIGAVVSFVCGALEWCIDRATWVVEHAGAIIERTQPAVDNVQTLSGWFGITPAGWIVAAVVSSAASLVIYELWHSERAK